MKEMRYKNMKKGRRKIIMVSRRKKRVGRNTSRRAKNPGIDYSPKNFLKHLRQFTSPAVLELVRVKYNLNGNGTGCVWSTFCDECHPEEIQKEDNAKWKQKKEVVDNHKDEEAGMMMNRAEQTPSLQGNFANFGDDIWGRDLWCHTPIRGRSAVASCL